MLTARLPAECFAPTGWAEAEQRAAQASENSLSELMRRAGNASWQLALKLYPQTQRFVVLCGAGNNGGDGYVFALEALKNDRQVRLFSASSKSDLAQSYRQQLQEFEQDIEPLEAFVDTQIDDNTVVIDALFGIGLNRPVEGTYRTVIEHLNRQLSSVVSLDIPSGLDSHNGVPLGVAIRASVTLTFIAAKTGLLTGHAIDHVGQLWFDDLGMAASWQRHGLKSYARSVMTTDLRHVLPPRPDSSHKGLHGHVLIIGGGIGLAGAPLLSGLAALRSGAGKVSIACHPDSYAAIAGSQPELMVRAVQQPGQLQSLIDAADVIAIGPGLGQDDWAQSLWQVVKSACKPLVIDADALHLLKQERITSAWTAAGASWLLTPHPGEAGALLDTDSESIQQQRWHYVQALQSLMPKRGNLQAQVLLKGSGSILTDGESSWVNRSGNAALAIGGSGDLLTGLCASLWASSLSAQTITKQTMDLTQVFAVAIWIHGRAGELAALENGSRGTLPTDLLVPIQRIVNGRVSA